MAPRLTEGKHLYASISRKADLIRKSGMRGSTVVSTLSISYPVNEEAKQAMDQYPAIGRAFCLPDSGRLPFEIVRLLSNTHFAHIRRFLEFIDKWVEVSGPIGKRVIQAKHPFELEQAAAELETFVHLYERFGTAVEAVQSVGNSVTPDVEVRFDAWRIRVEVYTPVDLIGFQLFERYVPMVLKYLDVSCGFDLDVTTRPLQQTLGYDQATLYYPYTIPEENRTHEWLAEFTGRTQRWLSNESPKEVLSMPGPGGEVEVIVKIVKLSTDSGSRQILSNLPTRSTDTKLFFEVGTAQNTAESQWGSKLKKKLKKQQCGQLMEGVLRMLLVNFAMADTGWPHFISGEKFGVRFGKVIGHLDDGRQHYDVVLPAQLGYECCFGSPVWINADRKETASDFIAQAGFDRRCEPPPTSTPQEIEDLSSLSATD